MNTSEEQSKLSVKLILFLGVVSGSMSSIFFKYMTAPSSVTATYRLGWTVLLLTPVVLSKYRKELFSLKMRELGWCALAGVFFAFHLYVWFESLLHTSISSSTVLVSTEVVFAAFGYLVFFGKRIKRVEIAAIAIAFAGSVIIAMADNGGGGGALWGDILALLAAALSAFYTLIGTRQREHISTTVYTYVLYWASFVTLLILDMVTGTPLFGYQPVDWGMSLCLAVFCTLLGHSIFSWSLKYLTPTFVSTAKLAGPVSAAIAALILFGEIPGALQLVGGAVVLGGVYLYTRHV